MGASLLEWAWVPPHFHSQIVYKNFYIVGIGVKRDVKEVDFGTWGRGNVGWRGVRERCMWGEKNILARQGVGENVIKNLSWINYHDVISTYFFIIDIKLTIDTNFIQINVVKLNPNDFPHKMKLSVKIIDSINITMLDKISMFVFFSNLHWWCIFYWYLMLIQQWD
jgi:hypothetical protein